MMLSMVLLGITFLAVGIIVRYLAKISVYDKSEQAVFSNEGLGDDHCVLVLQALLDAIGQTHMFIVKVLEHNLTGKIQTITTTKILSPEAPHPVADLEDEAIPPTSGDVLKTGSEESDPSNDVEDSCGDGI
ncbi:unnamed protein product [Eruca vesicaria subsp. sativa]|uniref:Uncharacterized protein n=1 Tax=Eruca vesicaria subsp. sativa TaxID=29727 RepID=A0ABC8JHW2_ERUVS|nr:unnamed protein product [Eruca vesicaria subsp. sativa]